MTLRSLLWQCSQVIYDVKKSIVTRPWLYFSQSPYTEATVLQSRICGSHYVRQHQMPHLQAEAIEVMSRAFRQMETSIDPPLQVPHRNSFVFRYANKGIHEALIQKLARTISGLNAVAVLLTAGYVQETGVLFRTLDELHEDIFFLASAETNGARTDRHTQFLEAFYSEAVYFRPEGSLDIQKPNLVPRKKIRAHTMNTLGQGVNVSKALTAGESLGTAYSGYVHAASEFIMNMFDGNPARFHIQGMRGTPRVADYAKSAQHYVYRGLMATIIVAKAFGDASLVGELYGFLVSYESANDRRPTPPDRSGA